MKIQKFEKIGKMACVLPPCKNFFIRNKIEIFFNKTLKYEKIYKKIKLKFPKYSIYKKIKYEHP